MVGVFYFSICVSGVGTDQRPDQKAARPAREYHTNAGQPMVVIDAEEMKQYINSFCVTPRGTWIISVTSGKIGEAKVYVRRSEDRGKTWSAKRIPVYDPQLDTRLKHPENYDCEMGQLYAVPQPINGVQRIYQISIVRNVLEGTRFGRLVYTVSEDDGRAWFGAGGPGTVFELDSPVYALPGHNHGWHLMAPPRLMSDGRVYLPMNASTDPKKLADIRCEVVFARSRNILTQKDPAKLNFDFTPPPPHGIRVPLEGKPGQSHGMEAQIVELSDHRLFTVMRTGNGCVYFSTSGDSGDTWSEPKPLRRDDDGDRLLNPNCACPLTKLSGGRYALLHCNNDGKAFGANSVFAASVVRHPIYVSVGVENAPGRVQPIRWSAPRLLTTLDGYQPKFGSKSMDLTYGLLHEEDGHYYHFYNARWESIQVNRIVPALLSPDWD